MTVYFKWSIDFNLKPKEEYYRVEYELLGLDGIKNYKCRLINNAVTLTFDTFEIFDADISKFGMSVSDILIAEGFDTFEINATMCEIHDDGWNLIMRDGEVI